MKRNCPHCNRLLDNPPYGQHFDCPFCGIKIYFSHCWKCGKPIAGTPDNQCKKCGWHYCSNCVACSPDCNELFHQECTREDVLSEGIGQLFATDADDPDYYDDGEMTEGDLEDEIPDACWKEWCGEDPSAYGDIDRDRTD